MLSWLHNTRSRTYLEECRWFLNPKSLGGVEMQEMFSIKGFCEGRNPSLVTRLCAKFVPYLKTWGTRVTLGGWKATCKPTRGKKKQHFQEMLSYSLSWHGALIRSSSHTSGPLVNVSLIFTLFYLFSTNSKEKYLPLQLLNASLCSPASLCFCYFGAEQEVYGGFSGLFNWKQLPAVAENDTMRTVGMDQNRVLDWKNNQWAGTHCSALYLHDNYQ